MEICIIEDEDVFVEASDADLAQGELEGKNAATTVCMCAINGFPVHNTPKILGEIAGTQVVTLLDSGSSHNVVNSELIEKLKLNTEPVQNSELLWQMGSK